MAENTEATPMETGSGQSNGRKVLIAMDGSKHSIHAFEWFADHIYRKTDNVIMAHCAELEVKLPTAALMGSPATIHAMVSEHEEHVKKVFKDIDEIAKKYGIEHTLERLNKPHKPGEAIVQAAEQQGVTLIVMGSRGHGTVRRTITGSVTDYVIHHSHVPIIVCKHEDEHHKLK